ETETTKKTGTIIDNNTFNYYNNPNCYSTRIYASELLKQADELLSIEELLKKEAAVLNGDEKDKLLAAANKLLKQAEFKQIQASEILGKINLQTFKANQFIYHDLLLKVSDAEVESRAESMDAEASYAIKQAKEMREEAYSQASNSAKLGNMTNAEEKENEALAQQNSAISLLKKSLAANISLYLTDLAVK
ncbi:MAG: hypothetical protein ACXVDC_15705, partial [Bacteroidia bacterium]